MRLQLKSAFFFFSVLLVALAAHGQEPLNPSDQFLFKGNWIGMSLAQWKANPENQSDVTLTGHPGTSTWRKKTVHILGAWCSDGSAGVPGPDEDDIADGPGDLLCSVALPGWLGVTDVGDVEVSNLTYDFRGGKLISIKFFFESSKYAGVDLALSAKYGQGKEGTAVLYQNVFGARWTGETKYWKRGDILLTLGEGSGNGPGRLSGYGGVLISGPTSSSSTTPVNF